MNERLGMAGGNKLKLGLFGANCSGGRALTRVPALLAHSGLDPRLAELINELLDRWPSLSSERRGALARQLLARVNAAEPSAALQGLDDAELQRRLRALVTAQA